MSWNYRILVHENPIEVYFEIHEVYYDNNKPTRYTKNPVSVGDDRPGGISEVLDMMKEATTKPILYAGDRFPEEWKTKSGHTPSKNPKYLVRPDDFCIFELEEESNCYRLRTKTKNRPRAMSHFTFDILTKNYGFFPIDETEIDMYNAKCTEHYNFLSWQTRSDGHGGIKGGTYEEYVDAITHRNNSK